MVRFKVIVLKRAWLLFFSNVLCCFSYLIVLFLFITSLKHFVLFLCIGANVIGNTSALHWCWCFHVHIVISYVKAIISCLCYNFTILLLCGDVASCVGAFFSCYCYHYFALLLFHIISATTSCCCCFMSPITFGQDFVIIVLHWCYSCFPN
jgi:hypothetical protein